MIILREGYRKKEVTDEKLEHTKGNTAPWDGAEASFLKGLLLKKRKM